MTSVPWWQSATIYQVYPRSFQDSNGDGIGDLRGIIRRIPYLSSVGIDAVWISPFYPSPMKDFGYDVSDYCGIDSLFGSMADFDELLAELRAHKLKLILDFVPNHTSDQHPWFVESKSSKTSPKRDWYIWRDSASDGGSPNNWLSEFGGSAWTFDAATSQYYHHAFLDTQPDLNWRNPQVRVAMFDAMRFWLCKGVDGFRIDVMWHLMKDEMFRDNPSNPDYDECRPPHERFLQIHSAGVDEVHDVVRDMRAVVDEFDDRLLIGEIYLPLERLVSYYGSALDGAHLPFNFSLLTAPWAAAEIANLVARYESLLPDGAWPNWVLGNHDRPRIAGRIGTEQARVAAMLLLTLRGTPTLYYADEIGLPQVDIPPSRIRDPFEINVPGKGVGRDGARTPMQWSDEPFAGFSEIEPWLPLAPGWERQNVKSQSRDTLSMLSLYRRLLSLRKSSWALQQGKYREISSADNVFVFERSFEGETVLVALNFGTYSISGLPLPGSAEILCSTHGDRVGEKMSGVTNLRAHEGVIFTTAGRRDR